MSAIIPLPEIGYAGGLDIKSAIHERVSVRSFDNRPLSVVDVANLMWSAQGYVRSGKRAVPSAGATFPLEIFLAVAENGVEGIEAGVYHYRHHYDKDSHSLKTRYNGPVIDELAAACHGQGCVEQARAVIAVLSEDERTTTRYKERGVRYCHIEAGHAGQNVSLMAVSLGLGTVMVGAYRDDEVVKALHLKEGIMPYYLIPVGHPVKKLD
ncbi:SagB/ThcOx family dehydrogenase [bacterium]|nr:SagB/ThcOx family dehydrogenase [bacterium]